ncbi:MAG: RIP metalloprotease RseP [Bacteroidetes bacterium]|jgi:regulator of sigma E protease|nr:MAG: RIP metalloprotease RseP [Bacteroidota bacterium]
MNHLLVIDWSVVGVKAGQFILSFSILIVLHELGHFLTAKRFGCRVEKFYLFFNPWFSLFKKKIGETEYGIGWIPLGGYVKISGMIDESMDKEQMKLPPKPYEFRSKPAWQRLIIMLGGVTVNVILAIIIFILIAWVWGDRYIPISNLKYGVSADSLGVKIGLKDGDKITAVAGKPVERVGTVGTEIISREAKSITVDRNGQKIELTIPEGVIGNLNKNRLGGFSYVRVPLIVDTIVTKKAKITKGNLQKGDTLIGFNGVPIRYNTDLNKLIRDYDDTVATYTLIRNGQDTVSAEVFYNKKGETYVGFKPMEDILGTNHIKYSFLQSIPVGFNKCWETLGRYINNLRQIFTSKEIKARDSLGSVISIGGIFPPVWDWQMFWTLTAIFSIILAFMNILPVPGLDGGHALFTIYEMVTGRKPSDKFMEYAQIVGFVLLLSLMAYALGLDIWRIFK